MKSELPVYRGITYNPSEHELASANYVEHVYRGKKYTAPLNHKSVKPVQEVKLLYRGSVYEHRQKDASYN